MEKGRTCQVGGCGRGLPARGLCQQQDAAYRKRPGARVRTAPRAARCAVLGCGGPYHARGLCQQHYDELRNKSAARRRRPPGHCRMANCGGLVHASGLCRRHYDHLRSSGRRGEADGARESGKAGPPPGPPHPHPPRSADEPDRGLRGAAPKTCRVPGCPGSHHAKGYCKSHYSQIRRHGQIREDLPARAGCCRFAGCSRPALFGGSFCATHRASATRVRLTKVQRLALIKRRHELMKREIELIRERLGPEEGE